MSFNLSDAVKGYFTNELIGQAAGYLGESDSVLKKGLDTVIPVSLAGLVNKAESGGGDALMSMARQAFDSGLLNNVGGMFSSAGGGVPSIGPSLISGLFGNKYGAIANAITSFTGMKGASTSSLLGSIVPLALALLGRHAKDNNSSTSAIGSLLGGMKNSIWSSAPSGFSLGSLFGAPETARAVHHVEPEKKGNKWLLPLLLGLAGFAAILYLMKGCGGDKVEEVATAVVDTPVVEKPVVVVNREPLKVTLPNGVVIDAFKGGIEDQLVAFLNDPNATPGKDIWFDFNDLNFEFGTANIIPDSKKEVDNIVQILKAFPKAKIKLGGYTDKVGDAAANKKLSQERADAVAAALKEAGVGAQVAAAEGYGSEFAKFPAEAPEEDRIKDRRVSVSVREK